MNLLKEKLLHPLKMGWYEIQIRILGTWAFFLKQQKAAELRIAKRYYNQEPINEQSDKDVVLMINGFTWSGGLADRLRAIVALYDWCNRHHRVFRLNFSCPFHLSDYLIPNSYDWTPRKIVFNLHQAKPKVCLLEPRTCNRKEVLQIHNQLIEGWCNSNLIDETTQLHVYSNLFRWDIDFGRLFNELFRPCERLQKEIDFHLQNISGSYISISFRFTTLLGDFTDCTGTPLPHKEQEKLIEKSLEVIKRISAQAPVHDRILVTADSTKFLEKAKNLADVYVIPGKVGHIDYDHGDDVNMKTFLDFFMISQAEAVYLAKGPMMYNSAFAKTAAMVNNRPFDVYEY